LQQLKDDLAYIEKKTVLYNWLKRFASPEKDFVKADADAADDLDRDGESTTTDVEEPGVAGRVVQAIQQRAFGILFKRVKRTEAGQKVWGREASALGTAGERIAEGRGNHFGTRSGKWLSAGEMDDKLAHKDAESKELKKLIAAE